MKRFAYIFVLCMLAAVFAGCGQQESADSTETDVVLRYNGEDIHLDEVYIYAETVKESYEEEYGADVWQENIQTDDGLEMQAGDAARRDAIAKLVRTKTLITRADEYGISLTSTEEAEQETAAEQFYELLTDEQIQESNLTLDTVKRVLEESALADKIYDYVMKQSSTEVSDEQARMSTFYDMFFECYYEDESGSVTLYSQSRIDERKKAADKAYEAIQEQLQDNQDFNISLLGSAKELTYAGTHTMSRDEILETYGEDVLNLLYGMSDGDISQVVETQYGYHIFQVLDITDDEATAENKEKLTEEANAEYYNNLMTEWIDELDSGYSYSKRVDEDVYGRIKFE